MRRSAFDFLEIDRARRLLELEERASIYEIKAAYRRLCKRWHPDAQGSGSDNSKMMQQINSAYRLLLHYCQHCRLSFTREEVESFDPEKWWYRRFGENIRARDEE